MIPTNYANLRISLAIPMAADINVAKLSIDGKHVACGDSEGRLRIVSTDGSMNTLVIPTDGPITAILWDPRRCWRLMIGNLDATVTVVRVSEDLTNYVVLKQLDVAPMFGAGLRSIHANEDGNAAVLCIEDVVVFFQRPFSRDFWGMHKASFRGAIDPALRGFKDATVIGLGFISEDIVAIGLASGIIVLGTDTPSRILARFSLPLNAKITSFALISGKRILAATSHLSIEEFIFIEGELRHLSSIFESHPPGNVTPTVMCPVLTDELTIVAGTQHGSLVIMQKKGPRWTGRVEVQMPGMGSVKSLDAGIIETEFAIVATVGHAAGCTIVVVTPLIVLPAPLALMPALQIGNNDGARLPTTVRQQRYVRLRNILIAGLFGSLVIAPPLALFLASKSPAYSILRELRA